MPYNLACRRFISGPLMKEGLFSLHSIFFLCSC
jgi:hypothetical protein